MSRRELKYYCDGKLFKALKGGRTVNIYIENKNVNVFTTSEDIKNTQDLINKVIWWLAMENINNKVFDELEEYDIEEEKREKIINKLEEIETSRELYILANFKDIDVEEEHIEINGIVNSVEKYFIIDEDGEVIS